MKKYLILASLAAGFLIGASALSAFAAGTWSAPTTIPPNGNVDAPINVGSTLQEKAGPLMLDSNLGVLGQSILMGNVGIGTTNPLSKLSIVASTSNTGNEGSAHGLSITTGTNYQTLWMGYDSSVDAAYINAAETGQIRPIAIQSRGGNVGIGTVNPSATLDVNGSVKLEGAGTPGAGKVLTSDATGNATWQAGVKLFL